MNLHRIVLVAIILLAFTDAQQQVVQPVFSVTDRAVIERLLENLKRQNRTIRTLGDVFKDESQLPFIRSSNTNNTHVNGSNTPVGNNNANDSPVLTLLNVKKPNSSIVQPVLVISRNRNLHNINTQKLSLALKTDNPYKHGQHNVTNDMSSISSTTPMQSTEAIPATSGLSSAKELNISTITQTPMHINNPITITTKKESLNNMDMGTIAQIPLHTSIPISITTGTTKRELLNNIDMTTITQTPSYASTPNVISTSTTVKQPLNNMDISTITQKPSYISTPISITTRRRPLDNKVISNLDSSTENKQVVSTTIRSEISTNQQNLTELYLNQATGASKRGPQLNLTDISTLSTLFNPITFGMNLSPDHQAYDLIKGFRTSHRRPEYIPSSQLFDGQPLHKSPYADSKVKRKRIDVDPGRYTAIENTPKVLEIIQNVIEDHKPKTTPKPTRPSIPDYLLPEQYHILKHVVESSNLENLRTGRSISSNSHILNMLGKESNLAKYFLPFKNNGTKSSSRISSSDILRNRQNLQNQNSQISRVAKSNPELISKIQKQLSIPVQNTMKQIGQVARPSIDKIKDIVTSSARSGKLIGQEAIYLAGETVESVLDGVKRAKDDSMWVATNTYYTALGTKDKVMDMTSQIMEDFGEFLGAAVSNAIDKAVEAAQLFGEFLHGVKDTAVDGHVTNAQAASKFVSSTIDKVGKTVQDTAKNIGDLTATAIKTVTRRKS